MVLYRTSCPLRLQPTAQVVGCFVIPHRQTRSRQYLEGMEIVDDNAQSNGGKVCKNAKPCGLERLGVQVV